MAVSIDSLNTILTTLRDARPSLPASPDVPTGSEVSTFSYFLDIPGGALRPPMFLSALPGLKIDPAIDLNRKFVGKLISIVERTIKEMGSSLSGQNVEALYKVMNQVKGLILERRGTRETSASPPSSNNSNSAVLPPAKKSSTSSPHISTLRDPLPSFPSSPELTTDSEGSSFYRFLEMPISTLQPSELVRALSGLELHSTTELNRKFVDKLISMIERTIRESDGSLTEDGLESLYEVVSHVQGLITEKRGTRETRETSARQEESDHPMEVATEKKLTPLQVVQARERAWTPVDELALDEDSEEERVPQKHKRVKSRKKIETVEGQEENTNENGGKRSRRRSARGKPVAKSESPVSGNLDKPSTRGASSSSISRRSRNNISSSSTLSSAKFSPTTQSNPAVTTSRASRSSALANKDPNRTRSWKNDLAAATIKGSKPEHRRSKAEVKKDKEMFTESSSSGDEESE
ncbi:hypothetical protein JCM5353_006784 [Sporobolomyces roseus]